MRFMSEADRVLVIGAGIGGLTAAVELARRGIPVTVVEKEPKIGGKMRQIRILDEAIDAGPTVLTMRHVFDEVFAAAGTTFDEHVTLDKVDILARHAWGDGSTLDLFSDIDRSADAIGHLAGPEEALGYRRFCQHAYEIHKLVNKPFLMSQRPGIISVVHAFGTLGIGALLKMDGYRTMWNALKTFFKDPRLLQLFGRYATYCGSSPFLAPGTLNVIAHVERQGVWLVRGGMYRLAQALYHLGVQLGVTYRMGAQVRQIRIEGGRTRTVVLTSGEVLRGEALFFNVDTAALAAGLFGRPVKRAALVGDQRSLSAMTWAFVGTAKGFPLIRHNVFFSDDYPAEIGELFEKKKIPDSPTVYVCAQDRDDFGLCGAARPEKLLCLVNAPADGDRRMRTPEEIERCETTMRQVLSRSGLTIKQSCPPVVTTPSDFDKMFPGTGGALYGAASHGWTSPFMRPSSRGEIPGLYICGGSAHPGAGVPMAAQSGRLAAEAYWQDLNSTSRSKTAGTRGGTSTRSAKTGNTASRSSS